MMKINPAQISTMALQNSKKSTPAPTPVPAPNAQTDQRLQSAPLGDAQSKLNAMPEVDMDRVDEMRTAIAEGKIEIDLDALTQAMQRYHQR